MSEKRERLPDHLLGKLPIEMRKALEHPCRRQILRALGSGGQKKSPSELTQSGSVSFGTPCTSYHCRTLEGYGLVRRAGTEPVRGSLKHYFTSLVADNDLVLTALKATEKSDQRHAAPAST